MRFLSRDECANWCAEHGYGAIDPSNPRTAAESTFSNLSYSTDSGKKIAFARAIASWSLRDGPCLIWITQWGVWPSSEHLPLYERFRQSLGEARPLIDVPGNVADTNDRDDALSVIAMGLLFFWDFYVFPAVPGPVFFASHDEYAGLHVPAGSEMPPDLAGW